MSMAEWKDRLDTIRRRCEYFDVSLTKSGYQADRSTLGYCHIGHPASEKEIQDAEIVLGFRLPTSMRNVLLYFAGSFEISWCLPSDSSIEIFKSSDGMEANRGGCWWSLEKIVEINHSLHQSVLEGYGAIPDAAIREYFLDFFTNRRFWSEIANGDYLMFRIDNNQQEISYGMHDGGPEDGFGAVLGSNFEEFIDKWMQLAFVGPEYWKIEPFLGKDGIDPNSDNGQQFCTWFFGQQT